MPAAAAAVATQPLAAPAQPAQAAAVDVAAPLESDHADVPAAEVAAAEPVAAGPAATATATKPAKKAAWPCPRCGAQVPIELDECGDCGASFLSGATMRTSTKLPVVGDIGRMTQSQRLMMGVGAAVLIMIVFFVLIEIASHIF